MSLPVSPDRHSSNKRIDKQQGEFDNLDGKRDGKIDIAGLSQEDKDALRKTYIDKVNTFQGKVRRSFEKIDVQRDMRTEQWRKWEGGLLDVETDLLKLLVDSYGKIESAKDDTYIVESLASYDLQIQEFLNSVSTLDEKYTKPSPLKEEIEKEQPTPRTVEVIFTEWNVPESARKAKVVSEKYGEQTIRDLDAALSLYETLPGPLRLQLFQTTADVRRRQIAGQLSNGAFEKSPLGFLLVEGSDKVEHRVLAYRESILDAIHNNTERAQVLSIDNNETLLELCRVAKIDVGADNIIKDIWSWIANTNGKHEMQGVIVKEIQKIGVKVSEIQQETSVLNMLLKQTEFAFNVFDTTSARNAGDIQQEAQLLFRKKINFGIETSMTEEHIRFLRPAQRHLYAEKYRTALQVSVAVFNQHIVDNPDLDVLDRTDIYSLRGTSTIKPDRARFSELSTDYAIGYHNETPDYSNAHFSQLRTARGRHDQKSRSLSVLTELGNLKLGGELVLVELPKGSGDETQTIIALRDDQGVVRLPDARGTVLKDPKILKPLRLNSQSDYQQIVYASAETEKFLRSRVGQSFDMNVVLKNNISPTTPTAPFPVDQFTVLDTSQLETATRGKNGEITFANVGGTVRKVIDAEGLRKMNAEEGQDVLRSIDHNPLIQDIRQRAGVIEGNMYGMQTLLSTVVDPKAYPSKAFVGQLHDYARPMLSMMNDTDTLSQTREAKKLLLSELKRVKLGTHLGKGMEREIQNRIDALDKYTNEFLQNDRLKHALETALEATPDTWGQWWSEDGLILIGAIILAIAATAALIAFTGGTGVLAAPTLWASTVGTALGATGTTATVVGGVAIAGVTAAGGVAGSEGTKELLYGYHHTLGEADEGEYRYTRGSRLGNYFREEKLFDNETGEYIEMGFLKDVASPYTKEFLIGFGSSLLVMGLAPYASQVLNKLARVLRLQDLAKRSPLVNKVLMRLSGIADDTAKLPKNTRQLIQKQVMQVVDEFAEETTENGAERALTAIDPRLGTLAALTVAALKGFKPLKGGVSIYPSGMSVTEVRSWIAEEGHTFISEKNGVFALQTCDGESVIYKPETASLDTEMSGEEQQAESSEVQGGVKTGDTDSTTEQDETRLEQVASADTEISDKQTASAEVQEEKESIDIAEVAREHDVTFIHGMSKYIPEGNSPLMEDGRVTFETKLRILLALEPTTSATALKEGDTEDQMWHPRGVILSGGTIEYASPQDAGTVSTTVTERSNITPHSQQKFDNDPAGRIRESIEDTGPIINEFVLAKPAISALYFDEGALERVGEGSVTWEQVLELEALGKKYDLPVYCMRNGKPHRFTYELNKQIYDEFNSEWRVNVLHVEGAVETDQVLQRKNIPAEQRDTMLREVLQELPFDPIKMNIPDAAEMKRSEDGKRAFCIVHALQNPETQGQDATYEPWPAENPPLLPKGAPIRIVGEFAAFGGRTQLFFYKGKLQSRFHTPRASNKMQGTEIVSLTRVEHLTNEAVLHGHQHSETELIAATRKLYEKFQEQEADWNPSENSEEINKDHAQRFRNRRVQLSYFLHGFAQEAEKFGESAYAQEARVLAQKVGSVTPRVYNEMRQRRIKDGRFVLTAEDLGVAVKQETELSGASPTNELDRVITENEFEQMKSREGFVDQHQATYWNADKSKYLYVKKCHMLPTQELASNALGIARHLTEKELFHPDTVWGVYQTTDGQYQIYAIAKAIENTQQKDSTVMDHLLTQENSGVENAENLDTSEWMNILLEHKDSHVLKWMRKLDPSFTATVDREPNNPLLYLLNFVEQSHDSNWGWDPERGKLYPVDMEAVEFNGDFFQDIIANWKPSSDSKDVASTDQKLDYAKPDSVLAYMKSHPDMDDQSRLYNARRVLKAGKILVEYERLDSIRKIPGATIAPDTNIEQLLIKIHKLPGDIAAGLTDQEKQDKYTMGAEAGIPKSVMQALMESGVLGSATAELDTA